MTGRLEPGQRFECRSTASHSQSLTSVLRPGTALMWWAQVRPGENGARKVDSLEIDTSRF